MNTQQLFVSLTSLQCHFRWVSGLPHRLLSCSDHLLLTVSNSLWLCRGMQGMEGVHRVPHTYVCMYQLYSTCRSTCRCYTTCVYVIAYSIPMQALPHYVRMRRMQQFTRIVMTVSHTGTFSLVDSTWRDGITSHML